MYFVISILDIVCEGNTLQSIGPTVNEAKMCVDDY